MSQADGQRHNRDKQLDAERGDMPAWLQPKQPATRSVFKRFALVYCALAIIALGLYQFGQQSGLVRLLESKVDGLLNPAPASGEATTDAVRSITGSVARRPSSVSSWSAAAGNGAGPVTGAIQVGG